MNLITTNIEAAIDKINAVYYEAGKKMLLLPNYKRSLQPLWWDEQCDNLKKQKYTYLRKFRASNLPSDLNEYKDRRNIFKNYCNAKMFELQRKKRAELLQNRKNPNFLWKKIRQAKPQQNITTSIEANEWHDYFRSLLYIML